jgi:Ca2+/Na+ antiporter
MNANWPFSVMGEYDWWLAFGILILTYLYVYSSIIKTCEYNNQSTSKNEKCHVNLPNVASAVKIVSAHHTKKKQSS